MRYMLALSGVLLASVAWCDVAVDVKAGTVTLDAAVAEQGQYDVLKGAVEYLLVADGGKTYETVFVTKTQAPELAEAFAKIGAKPGEPAADGKPPRGTPVRIFVERTVDGKPVRTPADAFIRYVKTGKPLEAVPWTYTGSFTARDPATGKDAIQASVTKSLVGLHYTDRSPLIQNPRTEARDENIYAADVKSLPKAGTAVRLVFEVVRVEVPKDHRRVHVFLTGNVQGVGFRNFTRRSALALGVTGWVQNLRDGRVEAVAEGPKDKVADLLEKMKQGPRYARVDDMKVTDEPPTGEFDSFEVRYPGD